MERGESIKREVEAILRSPSFRRSPSLAAILEYLLMKEIEGNGCPTQYDIAREALGKSSDFNETMDSSVRVQMSRLRKALADYYLTHQPLDGLYVYIRVGEYRLRTANLTVAYPDLASSRSAAIESLQRGSSLQTFEETDISMVLPTHATLDQAPLVSGIIKPLMRPLTIVLAIAGFFSLLLFAASLPASGEGDLELADQGEAVDVPYVELDVFAIGEKIPTVRQEGLRKQVEAQARELLLKSFVSRFETSNVARPADYSLMITLRESEADRFGISLILTNRSNEVVSEFSSPPILSAAQLIQVTEDEVIRIISPAGELTVDRAKQISGPPRSDFECFLSIESVRIKGADVNSLLDRCIDEFPDGTYAPYLQVRKAFATAQAKNVAGQVIDKSSPEWRLVEKVLEQHPGNSYANTLAAKLLIGAGQCEKAAQYARNAFSRGRTFPALELAVIIDAYGCPGMEKYREHWDSRILRIVKSNRQPHDLLETLIMLAALMSGQEEALDDFETPFASIRSDAPLAEMNRALLAAARGNSSKRDLVVIEGMAPAFIFNRHSRGLLRGRLEYINQKNRFPQSLRRPSAK